MSMLLRLGKTPLPVIVLPLPVPSSMTTPPGVEVSPSTNREDGVEAEVVLEGVQSGKKKGGKKDDTSSYPKSNKEN